MSSLLDLIIKWLPVADVPELIIRLFLAGDNCLDDVTLDTVFTTKYVRDQGSYLYQTFLHPSNRIEHSFDDQPARVNNRGEKCWLRNGKLHRKNGPAMILENGKRMAWYHYGSQVFGLFEREKSYFIGFCWHVYNLEWFKQWGEMVFTSTKQSCSMELYEDVYWMEYFKSGNCEISMQILSDFVTQWTEMVVNLTTLNI